MNAAEKQAGRRVESAQLLATLLGALALVPFVIGVYLVFATQTLTGVPVLAWLLIYAATIASFVGGIQWGWQLAQGRTYALDMIVAVCPALLAWGGLVMGEPWSFALVLFALVVAWLGDENGGRRGWQPWRFVWLRRVLSVVVLVCLVAIGWQTLRG